MATVERFGLSMEGDLLAGLDALSAARGYASRSDAVRALVRQQLVEQEWQDPQSEVIGTITLVYDHDHHDLLHALTDVQHRHHRAIVCSTHTHLDEANCLEVVIVRTTSRQAHQIADALLAARGVKHGRLVCTTTGRQVP